MSLSIKLEKVYIQFEGQNVASVRSEQQVKTFNTLDHENILECICEVRFRKSTQTRLLNPENYSKSKFSKTVDYKKQFDSNQNINEETRTLLSQTNEPIVFNLAGELTYAELLEIECFKANRKLKKKYI